MISSKDIANARKEEYPFLLQDNFQHLYPERWTSVGTKHREIVDLNREVLYILQANSSRYILSNQA